MIICIQKGGFTVYEIIYESILLDKRTKRFYG